MKFLTLAAASALALSAGSAGAAVFSYATDFEGGVGPEWSTTAGFNSGDAGILGQLDGGVATLSRSNAGGAGSGVVEFDLLGFRTIDGVNCCTDTFRLSVNGAEIFTGVFNLGGGGSESWTPAATVTGSGGSRHISIAFDAVEGANTFAFTYGALQGFGDEAWGLDNVGFRAEVADPTGSAAPEPSAWALMILGFGGAGAALRRRRTEPA